MTTRELRRSYAAVCLLMALGGVGASADAWQPAPGFVQIPIWPGAAPDAPPATGPEVSTTTVDLVAGKPYVWVENVTRPR
jgi:hypothetical protein